MRKVFIVLTAVMILSISAFAQLSGPLSGILAPGTYNVVGDISVEEGDSLTIVPGTDLLFDGYYAFGIYGYLYAVGTEADSIRFKPSVPDSTWGGIDFDSTASDSSRLGYCLITGGYASEEHPEGRGGGILCNGSSPTISNCLIIENVADWLGGGIYCYYSSPTIENCVIKHNLAGCYYGGNGGGICCYYSAPTIKNCTIEDNIADSWGNGGGIYCYGSSYSPTIDSCTIRGNIADKYGGGIFCDNSPTISNCTISGNSTLCDMGGGITCIGSGSSPTIENCAISDNSAGGDCGGIYCIDSSPYITNCTIGGNSTNYHGGGIYCVSSSATISYCVISGNTAGYDGGGIRCLNSSPTIENCTISGNSAVGNGGGIYTINSNLTMANTIVEGNMGYGGIYFYGSSSQNSSITYSDFYNNQQGSFTGSYIPQWLGTIATVNANGDSCDIYYNIFEDPLFEDPTNGNYQISWANYPVPDSSKSPCIDAGDPDSPLDPDSTIADIGAYYFAQGAGNIITVTLSPYGIPILIPGNGGEFDFNIEVANGSFQTTIDIWTMVTLPDGSEYGPIINFPDFTLSAGWIGDRDRTQNVPASAPSGNYTYDAYIGEYPDIVLSEDHFDFEKLAVSDGVYIIQSWDNCGEEFDCSDVESNILNFEFSILNCYPNPFNQRTALDFVLPSAGKIGLTIYDIAGREVFTLIDGYKSAGTHSVVFDAKDLSSGVYFAKLSILPGAGTRQHEIVRKMLLLK